VTADGAAAVSQISEPSKPFFVNKIELKKQDLDLHSSLPAKECHFSWISDLVLSDKRQIHYYRNVGKMLALNFVYLRRLIKAYLLFSNFQAINL
jgi:hypothetical protein